MRRRGTQGRCSLGGQFAATCGCGRSAARLRQFRHFCTDPVAAVSILDLQNPGFDADHGRMQSKIALGLEPVNTLGRHGIHVHSMKSAAVSILCVNKT